MVGLESLLTIAIGRQTLPTFGRHKVLPTFLNRPGWFTGFPPKCHSKILTIDFGTSPRGSTNLYFGSNKTTKSFTGFHLWRNFNEGLTLWLSHSLQSTHTDFWFRDASTRKNRLLLYGSQKGFTNLRFEVLTFDFVLRNLTDFWFRRELRNTGDFPKFAAKVLTNF